MCTLYTYTNICIPRFSPSGFFGPSRCLIPTPGLPSEHPICAVCVLFLSFWYWFYWLCVCFFRLWPPLWARTRNRRELVPGPKDSSRWFRQNLGRRRYGKSEWTKRESSRRKTWLHACTQNENGWILAGNGIFWKSRSVGKATGKRWLQQFRRRLNEQKSWRKLDTDHQRGLYYEHCSRWWWW